MNARNAMIARARTRQETETIKFVRELPAQSSIDSIHFRGASSVYIPKTRERFVIARDTVDLAPGVREIASHPPRDYLNVLGLRGARLRKYDQQIAIRQILNDHNAYPMFAIPSRFDDAYYIDIRRAWFSILLNVGWNCSYHPGKFLLGGYRPYDFPLQDLRLRDYLVTLALPKPIRVYHPGSGFHDQVIRFPFENSTISAVIRDILAGIANDARDIGAVWGAMDGYICPSHNIARDVQQMILEWGLESRIKLRGAGQIDRFDCYKIGDHQTARVCASPRARWGVREIETKRWLQNRIGYLSQIAGDFKPRAARVRDIQKIDRIEI